MSWLDEEPRLTIVAYQQMRRLAGRALRRPAATALLGLGISAILFAVQTRWPKLHNREVGLLITEGAFAPDGRPRPRGELREFIDRAVFTLPRLEELAAKHDLVKKFRVANLGVAIDCLRQHTDVGIWQDYFEDYRQGQDPPRTVRVTVGFSAQDPETALAVARDLGQLVAETQTQREADAAAERVKAKRILADSAAARTNGLHEELERMKMDALEQPGGDAYVGLQRMKAAAQATDATAAALAGELMDAELQERAVRQVGQLVHVIDPGSPLWNMTSRVEQLAVQSTVALSVGMFLAVFLVGALDPTIRDQQDLRRVRVPYLGSVPVLTNETGHEV